MSLKRDIEFMFEMGSVRFMERMWRRFLHDDFANQAEHHFRVFWIAMVIAAHEKGADTGRIAKMALAHDIAENRTGDVDYLARQYSERKTDLAISDMLADTALQKEFYELVQEYEARETLEAKIVKDADNLDVDFELAEQAAKGSQLRNVKHDMRNVVSKTKLYTETAKKIYKELQTANPHDWHYNARNRINSGDWKQK